MLEFNPELVQCVKPSETRQPFVNVGRGIRQGSVSPTLFNLVLDPLLLKLSESSLGLSVNGLFLGAFAHAEDIRTLASNLAVGGCSSLFY